MSLEDSFDLQITEFRVRSHPKAGVILRLDFTDGGALGRAQGRCSYEEREPRSLPYTELHFKIQTYKPCIPKIPSEQTRPGDRSPTYALHLIPQSQVIPLTRKKRYSIGEKEYAHLWTRHADTGTPSALAGLFLPKTENLPGSSPFLTQALKSED